MVPAIPDSHCLPHTPHFPRAQISVAVATPLGTRKTVSTSDRQVCCPVTRPTQTPTIACTADVTRLQSSPACQSPFTARGFCRSGTFGRLGCVTGWEGDGGLAHGLAAVKPCPGVSNRTEWNGLASPILTGHMLDRMGLAR